MSHSALIAELVHLRFLARQGVDTSAQQQDIIEQISATRPIQKGQQ